MDIVQKLKRKTLRALFRYDPSYTDMFTDKSELYFARLYLHQTHPYWETLEDGAKILDAGCQSGRFTIPLAKMGFEVTGIDTSGLSLNHAQKHCRESGVKAKFLKGDIGRVCPSLEEGSFDAVLCAEVLYLHPHYETLMKNMIRVLKPGGLLVTSHRTKFYYLMKALAQKDYPTARFIAENNEGSLWGTYFNWQTVRQLRQLHQLLGLRSQGIHPIGIFSEIYLAPGELEPSLQDQLFQIEKDPFDEITGCTRYLLAVGEKIPASHSDLP
ncbi:MAG: class I SAM-dependent methyltransferase [Candidatus Omnitrophica bacterium]|nr:class I SAM-dependent methyltransferase [Candidatus Omnitrophota bacterium]